MPERDYYAILGVAKDADEDALKKAYKKQAVRYHPDKHASKSESERKTAEEKFKDVAEAFEVLSDKDKRAVYDRYGEAGLKAGGPGGPGAGGMPGAGGGMPAGFAGGFPGGGASFSFSTDGSGGGGMDAARAQAMFEQLFGGMGGGGLGGGLGGGGVRVMRGGRKGGMGGMGGMGGLFDMNGMDENDPFGGLMGGGMMGGGAGQRPRRGGDAAARVDQLAPGTVVRLQGLSSAAHNNGAVGTVASFDAAKERYVVSLQRDGASLAVKRGHLLQVVTEARVTGTSKSEINGRTASSATYDRAAKRYRCEGLQGDGTVLSLRPENVVLPEKTRVTIDGVASRPALNGCVGAVRAVDEVKGRYDVQLAAGEAVSVRFGAVAAC